MITIDQNKIAAMAAEKAKSALLEIDIASIRDIREYIASKADAPKRIKDMEAAAVAERAKVKP